MSEIFFTSDLHFGHKNILKFGKETRPFSSIEEHDEQVVKRFNSRVGNEDHVYILGDISFYKKRDRGMLRERLDAMNGHKHLILGNHDENLSQDDLSPFKSVRHYHERHIGGKRVIMFHFPIYDWHQIHRDSFHLYGHTHGRMPFSPHGYGCDVGLDTNQCYPWHWEELVVRLHTNCKSREFRYE